jgi:hypothetical protein
MDTIEWSRLSGSVLLEKELTYGFIVSGVVEEEESLSHFYLR